MVFVVVFVVCFFVVFVVFCHKKVFNPVILYSCSRQSFYVISIRLGLITARGLVLKPICDAPV